MSEEQLARKKAKEFIDKADGEMKTFWMWRSKDNFYNAGKHLQNAAVQYKIAKDYEQAALTYLRAAEVFADKGEDKMQTTLSYNEAGVCYKFVDMTKAVECFNRAALSYKQMNRWSQCGKLFDEVAQLYDGELFDRANAIKAYIECGEAYKLANSPTSAHGAFFKAANLHADNEDFLSAISLYEVNAEHYAKQGGAMAHQVNANAFRALLCMMVQEIKKEKMGDLVKSKEKYDEYNARFPTFDGDDNSKLIGEVLKAYAESDGESFQTAVGKRRFKLDEWSINQLVIVKRGIDGTLDVRADGTPMSPAGNGVGKEQQQQQQQQTQPGSNNNNTSEDVADTLL